MEIEVILEPQEEAIENIKEALELWLEPDQNEILAFKDNFETKKIRI